MASLITRSILCLALASFSYASPVVTLAPRAVVLEDASQLKSAYDYVVIGGGTSGLVVANRLTEDSAGTYASGV